MSNQPNKPSHRMIRFYGTGRNAPRAELGAVWSKEDGSLAIRLDTPSEQIWLQAFPIEHQSK